MKLWFFTGQLRRWMRNVFDSMFGTFLRRIVSALVILLAVLVWNGISDNAPAGPSSADLDRAIDLSHSFEKENRWLKEDLANERRLRRVAEQTITALSDNLRSQDEAILDMQQRLSFYRQLLEERESPGDEIVIRTFVIVPDYREFSYQLLAVLVRSGADSEPFRGSLDLALSLRDGNGEEFEYSPVFQLGALGAEFRYYHEIEAVFSVPQGTEILNGQLALFSEDGELMSSRILHDQAL